MTRGPQSSSRDLAEATTGTHHRHEAGILEELVRLGPPATTLGEPAAWHAFSPLVSWLIAATRPAVTVELGPGDRTSLRSTCDAVARIGAGARFVPVRLGDATPRGAEAFDDAVRECTTRHPGVVTGDALATSAPAALLAGADVDLLHVSLFDLADAELEELPAWLDACAPGTVIVISTTASGASAAFDTAVLAVSGRFPSVALPLGDAAEALVGQVSLEGDVPAVDMLRRVPAAVGQYLAVLGQPAADLERLGIEPMAPPAIRAVVAALIERHDVERAALLAAVGAYREYTAGLAAEIDEARRSLVAQEHLVEEFLNRLDELSAKVSTSAARFTAQLEEKDRLLEAEERKVLAYAGQAADAQAVIDDMQRSSSWRATAPLRVLSRVMARRRPPQSR